MGDSGEVIIIGVGEAEDPFPGGQKPTLYYVHAGPCPRCRSETRFLLPESDSLVVLCPSCRQRRVLGLRSSLWPEVTYVHWCRQAEFASDKDEVDPSTRAEIERMLVSVESRDPPGWGVWVIGGRCQHAHVCVRKGCPYRGALP